jgi:hypothetical protein
VHRPFCQQVQDGRTHLTASLPAPASSAAFPEAVPESRHGPVTRASSETAATAEPIPAAETAVMVAVTVPVHVFMKVSSHGINDISETIEMQR